MFKNVFEMPLILVVLVLAGLATPLLVLGSVLTGVANLNPVFSISSPAIEGFLEIFVGLIFSAPMMCSVLWMLRKSKASCYAYVVSWCLLDASQLVLVHENSQAGEFWVGFIFLFLLGLVMLWYFLFSDEVKKYFVKAEEKFNGDGRI